MPDIICGDFVFVSDFDSSNIARVEQITKKEPGNDGVDFEFSIWTHPDCAGTEFENNNRSWFYFGITGGVPFATLKLNIVNLNRQCKMYSQGMAPVTRTSPGKQQWERIRDRPTFSMEDNVFTVSWKYRTLENLRAVTYFAFTYPYSYTDLQANLRNIDIRFLKSSERGPRLKKTKKINSKRIDSIRKIEKKEKVQRHRLDDIFYKRECICFTAEGRRVDLLTISSYHGITSQREPRYAGLFPEKDVDRPFRFPGKKVIFFSARVHPGETPSSFVMNGVIQLLLSRDDPIAISLRRLYVFKLMPMLNPDGVSLGHYRTDTRGVNLNRFYLNPSPLYQPSVFAAKAVILYHYNGNESEDLSQNSEGNTSEKPLRITQSKSEDCFLSIAKDDFPNPPMSLSPSDYGLTARSTKDNVRSNTISSLPLRECSPMSLSLSDCGLTASSTKDSVHSSTISSSAHPQCSSMSLSPSNCGLTVSTKDNVHLNMISNLAHPAAGSNSIVSETLVDNDSALKSCPNNFMFPENISVVINQGTSCSEFMNEIPAEAVVKNVCREKSAGIAGDGEKAVGACEPISESKVSDHKAEGSVKDCDSISQSCDDKLVPSDSCDVICKLAKKGTREKHSEELRLSVPPSLVSSISHDSLLSPRLFSKKVPWSGQPKTGCDSADSGLFLYVDFHGHASKKGIFMYGNHFNSIVDQVECLLLPKLMSINSQNFHFSACNFTEKNMYLRDRRDGLSREGSGRVAVLKTTGLLKSYTLECNYNTGRLVNTLPPPLRAHEKRHHNLLVPPKYTPQIFEEVGRALGASILDLTGSNPNSRLANSEYYSLNGVRDALKLQQIAENNLSALQRNVVNKQFKKINGSLQTKSVDDTSNAENMLYPPCPSKIASEPKIAGKLVASSLDKKENIILNMNQQNKSCQKSSKINTILQVRAKCAAINAIPCSSKSVGKQSKPNTSIDNVIVKKGPKRIKISEDGKLKWGKVIASTSKRKEVKSEETTSLLWKTAGRLEKKSSGDGSRRLFTPEKRRKKSKPK